MRKLIFATFTLICTLASAVLISLSLTGRSSAKAKPSTAPAKEPTLDRPLGAS